MATNLPGPHRRNAAALAMALAAFHALAGGHGARALQPAAAAHGAIERFLAQETDGLPGQVKITLAAAATHAWPACADPQPFLPTGVRAWGRVSVGVRCAGDTPWTRYASAYVAVLAPYQVAARTLASGEALGEADAENREGDLAALPAGVVTDASELAGKVARHRIVQGAPLRRELLRGALAVRQGQLVRVVVRGAGFVAGTEGKALTDATAGATVQVKLRDGSQVSGVAREDGSVERAH